MTEAQITDMATPYRLAEGVAIRPERFGALVYRYDNRRLYFIHSHAVAAFVTGLDGTRPLDHAIESFIRDNDLEVTAGETLEKTVGQLTRMGIVEPIRAG